MLKRKRACGAEKDDGLKLGIFGKSLVIASALVGGVVFSQAPEFTQQYRQRLGGAVDELRSVTENFDRDANAANLTRNGALLSMQESNDRFSRDRSVSMRTSIDRFEVLRGQREALERAPPIFRPVNAMATPDIKIVREAWNGFQPAVPINPPGLIWAFIGALLGGSLMAVLLRMMFRRRKVDHSQIAYAQNPPTEGAPAQARQEPRF